MGKLSANCTNDSDERDAPRDRLGDVATCGMRIKRASTTPAREQRAAHSVDGNPCRLEAAALQEEPVVVKRVSDRDADRHGRSPIAF